MMQMWIRGVLCNIDGYAEGPDWSVGITGSYFMPDKIVRADNGEDMPELTDGGHESISDAYWSSLPFDPYNHCVYEWSEYCDYPMGDENFKLWHTNWRRYWIPSSSR